MSSHQLSHPKVPRALPSSNPRDISPFGQLHLRAESDSIRCPHISLFTRHTLSIEDTVFLFLWSKQHQFQELEKQSLSGNLYSAASRQVLQAEAGSSVFLAAQGQRTVRPEGWGQACTHFKTHTLAPELESRQQNMLGKA